MVDENPSQKDVNAECSRQFLIVQLSEMSEDWRHLDKRIETALTLYISVCTLIVGGIAVASSNNDSFNILRWEVGVAALVLCAYGFFTVRRVKNASISRHRRQVSINLIKLFFEKCNPEISPYLPVYNFTPKPLMGIDDETKRLAEFVQHRPSLPNGIAIFLYLLNSLLGGLAYLCFVSAPTPVEYWVAGCLGSLLMVLQVVYYFWGKLEKLIFKNG